jgi:hypothetical protein
VPQYQVCQWVYRCSLFLVDFLTQGFSGTFTGILLGPSLCICPCFLIPAAQCTLAPMHSSSQPHTSRPSRTTIPRCGVLWSRCHVRLSCQHRTIACRSSTSLLRRWYFPGLTDIDVCTTRILPPCLLPTSVVHDTHIRVCVWPRFDASGV